MTSTRQQKTEAPATRTLAEQHSDALLFLLLNFAKGRHPVDVVKISILHELWGLALNRMKVRGLELEGFVRDDLSNRYPSLDSAFEALKHKELISTHDDDNDTVVLLVIYPNEIRIYDNADKDEWRAVEDASRIIRDWYKERLAG
jgi:hypothetical protein